MPSAKRHKVIPWVAVWLPVDATPSKSTLVGCGEAPMGRDPILLHREIEDGELDVALERVMHLQFVGGAHDCATVSQNDFMQTDQYKGKCSQRTMRTLG